VQINVFVSHWGPRCKARPGFHDRGIQSRVAKGSVWLKSVGKCSVAYVDHN
jgi:hypothetical protein